MPIDLDAQIAHDPSNLRDALERMQGNILKGHGREHTVHIFVSFSETDSAKLRSALRSAALSIVTSGWTQLEERQIFKDFGIPGGTFGNLFLTRSGYEKLGLTASAISTAFTDPLFSGGMKSSIGALNDPQTNSWESGYQDEIDAMFLLADDDKAFLLRQARDFLDLIKPFCELRTVERGDALRDPVTNEGIEHFGYVDGRSQPIYLDIDLPAEGSTTNWDPVEPLRIVLVEDKTVDAAAVGPDNFGSYFVFRKLEQNVRDFAAAEETLADNLGFSTPEQRERAGAMTVGRFKDGTPIVLSQTDGFIPAKENDFNYASDDIPGDAGLKCPYQAHIRKMNPRGDVVRHFPGTTERNDERDHRITRRGIPFGERPLHPNAPQTISELPSAGVGLLFMCFQSNIVRQFAFLQRSWANNENFVNNSTGVDPIIGQAGPNPVNQTWIKKWGGPADTGPDSSVDSAFRGFVTMKGGEYFFAPCIEFIKGL